MAEEVTPFPGDTSRISVPSEPAKLEAASPARAYSVGGSGGGRMDDQDREMVDQKIANAELRISAEMSGIRGELVAIREALGNTASPLQVWGAAFTGIVAVVGIMLAVMSIAGDRFDGGMAAGSIVSQSLENAERIEQIRDSNEERDRKIDLILSILQERTDQ